MAIVRDTAKLRATLIMAENQKVVTKVIKGMTLGLCRRRVLHNKVQRCVSCFVIKCNDVYHVKNATVFDHYFCL